jgi:hypothetical protein
MVRIDEVETLSHDRRRNFIARARAIYDDGRVHSVIIKATRSRRYDPAADNALEDSGLVREWTATAYILARAPGRGHGATLLAGDVSHGLIVFEDLGANLGSLVDPLLKGTADAAERALTLYANALARLHADTADCLESHHATFQAIFGAGRPLRPQDGRVEKQADFIVERLGGAPPASELELLSSRLSDPGPWQSLVHGDPCPDNALIVGNSIRLIDYEFAQPSHALLDGTSTGASDFRPAGVPGVSRMRSQSASTISIGRESEARCRLRSTTRLIAWSSPTRRRSGSSPVYPGGSTRR